MRFIDKAGVVTSVNPTYVDFAWGGHSESDYDPGDMALRYGVDDVYF